MSWSLLTFFALPVFVVEGAGLFPGLRRSLALGRRELGNWVAGGVSLFVTTVAVLVVGLAVLILTVESDSVTVMVSAAGAVLALWLMAGLLSATASGIYRITLYQQAAAAGRSVRP